MKSRNKKQKFQVQQSDILIRPDGEVVVSFLYDDLGFFPEAEPRNFAQRRSAIDIEPISFSDYQSCKLCPKQCGFDRVAKVHPRCGDAQLRVSSSGLSHGDEPEIRGTRGSGTIMLGGCPLKCPHCHNPEMVSGGEIVSARQFLEICYELESKGAHNLQILSPTVHFPALLPILRVLKASGFSLPIVFKSSGYEVVSELKKFSGLVDIYLSDFKFGSGSNWAVQAGVRNYFSVTSAALEEMLQQTGAPVYNNEGCMLRGTLIRHVMAPLPELERAEILATLSRFGNQAKISLQNNFQTLY